MLNGCKSTMKKLCACFSGGKKQKEQATLRRKMVIVGDGACGKTCLVTRMSTGNFVDIGYIPTVFETEVVNVATGSENVDLVIFDTAGQEDYDRLRPFSYSDVDVALICFSLADQDTLTNVVDNWTPEIRYFCGDVPIILVGNKKDLRDAESSSTHSRTNTDASLDSLAASETDEGKANELSKTTNLGEEPASQAVFSCSQSTSTDVIPDGHIDEMKRCQNNHAFDNEPCRHKPHDNLSSVRPLSHLYPASARTIFHAGAPVKHSEGVAVAKRIGAMAYFETSALSGDNVEELLLATTKAAVLGTKRSKKFKPFANTMSSWKSTGTHPVR